jgi:hypothetical protein
MLVKLAWGQMRNTPGLRSETRGTREPSFDLTEAWLVANGF